LKAFRVQVCSVDSGDTPSLSYKPNDGNMNVILSPCDSGKGSELKGQRFRTR